MTKWLMALMAVPVMAAVGPEVRVEGGVVRGARGRDAGVMVFKGVPFAAAPVGELRWRAPGPVVGWEGVRSAEAFGASCTQEIVDEKKPWTYEFMAHTAASEDCLNLNVWTGAKGARERRPVYVYIHGGANREGSGAVPAYDGEALAKKGIVVVTVNYRLGVFGFLAHPELSAESGRGASGNYAILDLIAALKWVRANIGAFGGDAEKVTVGGQSAGASNTHVLTASALARGLFRGAIAQSGSTIGTMTGAMMRPLKEAEEAGLKFAAGRSIAELRKVGWQELMASSGGGRFGTVVDGYVLEAPIGEVFAAGKQNDVATLTGCNKGEGGAVPQPETTAEKFAALVRERYGEEGLRLWPAATDEQARAAQNEVAWDAARTSMWLWAAARAKTAKTAAYTYFWDHVLPGPDAAKYGAFHTSEVVYVMNSLAMSGRPFADEDRRIAEMMSSYWANFIATGNPNGRGLARWPAVGERPAATMELGDRAEVIGVAGSEEKLGLLERRLAQVKGR